MGQRFSVEPWRVGAKPRLCETKTVPPICPKGRQERRKPQPSPILLDYATTKAGIVAYTKALAKQLIERGIRANVVAPGPVWTVLQPSGGQPDEKVKNFGKDSDFGRPGQPVELAPVFVLLASQEASFINGEVYGVTGGKGVA